MTQPLNYRLYLKLNDQEPDEADHSVWWGRYMTYLDHFNSIHPQSPRSGLFTCAAIALNFGLWFAIIAICTLAVL